MHFEVSLVVKAPRDRAYSSYTDFESMPKWSKDRREVRIARREGDTVYLELTLGAGGSSGAREMKLFPPDRVESEGETRFTRTKSVVKFDEVPEGTRITASLDVELKGHWSWVFKTQGKAEAESTAMEELVSFAKHVESPSSGHLV
ncbi:MAG TPA: SRPBCC family protein [Nitrososphaerales archaeon]|nr:SRPBCC family protein [Nitrososphaerales archaeon]